MNLVTLMGEETPKFSSLIDLFKSIGIVEKGIEQVYDYLLINKKCNDLKILEANLKLNTKRIYKITSVLKELGLIQIYHRPMKLQINSPIEAWEALLSDTIEKIQSEAKQRIKACKNSYTNMENAYNFRMEKEKLPPVEFFSFKGPNKIKNTFYSLLSKYESCIANGIWYHRGEDRFREVQFAQKVVELALKSGILESINNTKLKVLVSEEYIEYLENIYPLFSSKVFQNLAKNLKIDANKFDIRLCNQPFSNFIVKDKETLIQPSFDPNNNLIGYFISTPQEIVDVFYSKFNALFKESKPIPEEKDELFRFLISL